MVFQNRRSGWERSELPDVFSIAVQPYNPSPKAWKLSQRLTVMIRPNKISMLHQGQKIQYHVTVIVGWQPLAVKLSIHIETNKKYYYTNGGV